MNLIMVLFQKEMDVVYHVMEVINYQEDIGLIMIVLVSRL
jgi:hypothetical protein